MRARYRSLVPIAAALVAACDNTAIPTAPNTDATASIGVEVDWQPIRDCNVAITQPGHYRLMADLIDCPAEAGSPLAISASNVVLDLKGHTIAMTHRYAPHLVGLHVGAVSDVQVLGPGTIRGFTEFGIEVVGASNLLIRKVTLRENDEAGVNAAGLTNALLHDNTFLHNRDAGAVMVGKGLRLLYNQASLPTTHALLVGRGSSDVEVRGNVITGAFRAITLRETTGALMTANQATGNAFGLTIESGATGNRVIGNRFEKNWEVDMVDQNGCGPNIYKGNVFATASPKCLQAPRSSF